MDFEVRRKIILAQLEENWELDGIWEFYLRLNSDEISRLKEEIVELTALALDRPWDGVYSTKVYYRCECLKRDIQAIESLEREMKDAELKWYQAMLQRQCS